MKPLIISASDLEGGAPRAALRLHQGLRRQQVDSQMLVQKQLGNGPNLIAPQTSLQRSIATMRRAIDALPLKRYSQRSASIFSPQWLPETTPRQIRAINPDIINLHWVCDGFIRIESLTRYNRPIVWSLHDMWPFTGGCHYDQGCNRYQQTCGTCPQLGSQRERDLSRQIWRRKQKAWRDVDLTIVALSSWMADCARSSSLFKDVRIEVIHNGLDLELYRPVNKGFARTLLQLPQDKQTILFGAVKATSDARKGFDLLQAALQSLGQTEKASDLELAVFGANTPEQPPEFGLKTHYLGSFNDDLSLVLAYAAADVFVLPSRQENLANTVVEALACGTPCVAFKVGGNRDMIESHQNGYLASAFDVEDLAKGIYWVLEDPERHYQLANEARDRAIEKFNITHQVACHKRLYEELLELSS